jgi:hypothetical protein
MDLALPWVSDLSFVKVISWLHNLLGKEILQDAMTEVSDMKLTWHPECLSFYFFQLLCLH